MYTSLARPSPDVLCKAVKDVVGLDFNPTKDEEAAAAAILVGKLLANSELADELANSLARHSRPAPPTQMHRTEQFGSAQLRTIDARVLADDPLQRDFPSESTLDLTPEAKSWPVLSAIDKSFITISPEVLGFHPPSSCIEWNADVEKKWELLLSAAERKVSSKPNYLQWFKTKFSSGFSSSITQEAKNYSVFILETDKHKSTAHFLFDPCTLYVLVVRPQGKESRFEVAVEDTDRLATKLVSAFDGHEDYARFALRSMSKAFLI